MAFTNYIQQIKDTNNTTHDLVDTSASHYVKGTQTGSTNVWTGVLPDGVTAYYDGLSIDYFLPYAGTTSGATLNLGSKGAKPVYVGNSTTQATTHYPQYSVIHLTYLVDSRLNSGNGCWKATGYYDTNTNNAVTQTATTTNANYEILFSETADNTTRTEGARKTDSLIYNPSTKLFTIDNGTIKANHGKFSFLEAEDLQAGTATVTGLLDVKGELHTNKWTNTNIANVGGSFYVSPTYKSSTATIVISGSANSRTITITSASFGSASSSGLSVSSWTSGSEVLLTGSVTHNNTTYPLGTCKGTLYAPLSQTGATIQGVSSNALETLYSIFNSNSVSGVDIEISLLTIGGTKPVGILLTSYGASQSTYLDIYGGTNSNTGSPTVPNAEPNLRIGYLGNGTTNYNLQKLGGSSEYPKGWGIYTDNGYFKGTIVASSGRIGDGAAAWFIGNDGDNRAYIYSGISNITTSGSTAGTYVGTNGISNYSSGTQYVNLTGGKITAQGADISGVIKATSGIIGNTTNNNITISANTTNAAIYSKSHSTLASTGDGFYLGSDGISIGSKFKYTGGTTNSLTIDTITATNFTLNSGSIDGSVTIGGVSGTDINNNISTAQTKATGYITDITSSGIFVHDYSNSPVTPSTSGANGIHISSSSVDVVKNGSVISSYSGSGMYLYDGNGTANTNIIANFTSTGTTIGKSNDYHTSFDNTGLSFYNGSSEYGSIRSSSYSDTLGTISYNYSGMSLSTNNDLTTVLIGTTNNSTHSDVGLLKLYSSKWVQNELGDYSIKGASLNVVPTSFFYKSGETVTYDGVDLDPIISGGTTVFQCDSSGNVITSGNISASGSITVKDHSSAIGTVKQSNGNYKITTTGIDVYTQGPSITCEAGTWVVIGTWVFQTGSSTGARNMTVALSTASGSTNDGMLARTRIHANSNAWASLQATYLATFSSSTTIYCKGSSSMTYTTAANVDIRAVRIA